MNEHLTPGHWIAIATIAVAVLGGVISVALGEHNARLENVGTRLTRDQGLGGAGAVLDWLANFTRSGRVKA